MKSHDRLRIVFAQIRQNWRAFAHVMHVHENHCIKRAGVAGIRARATAFFLIKLILSLLASSSNLVYQLRNYRAVRCVRPYS
ncbi:hypothetical protein EIC63_18990 [Escherichia coli]|nr:hypothetical protein [Escherichia coli]EFA4898709.1 hypothetical protein [Escherichia coli]EFB5155532.1 hypothetical protein [Escherichia coli]EFN7290865.1 hypothetical protein [Escherichia coli O8:H10]